MRHLARYLLAILIGATATGGHAAETVTVLGVTPEGATCMLGGGRGTDFIDPEKAATAGRHGMTYTLVDLSGAREEVAAVSRPQESLPGGDCAVNYAQELALAADMPGRFAVALSEAPDTVAARLPKQVSTDGHGIRAKRVLERFLKSQGLDTPRLVLRQSVAVDLDRDGAEELIVNAVNTSYGTVSRGEYSVVLVHDPAAGEDAPAIPVHSEVMLEDRDEVQIMVENTVVAVADIAGAPGYELVLYGAFAYGDGWEVIEVEDGAAWHVLSCGCGG